MTWKFWKKPEEDESISSLKKTRAVPMSTLFRWHCYDIGLENPSEIDAKVGLTPISEEIAEKEEQESLKRLTNVVPYMPFLNSIAAINSIVFTESHIKMMMEVNPLLDSLPEEAKQHAVESMTAMYEYLSVSALVSAFSSGIELGLIIPTLIDIEEGHMDDDLDLSLYE